LTDSLLDEFAEDVASWTLRPSSGGRFEVLVDGELVFSKAQLGRHPKRAELRELLKRRIEEG